jgi:hypothetical protein
MPYSRSVAIDRHKVYLGPLFGRPVSAERKVVADMDGRQRRIGAVANELADRIKGWEENQFPTEAKRKVVESDLRNRSADDWRHSVLLH